MCINIAVGNPPYQDEGGSGGTNDAPIYQKFCKVAKENTSSMSSLVIPAKWFTGGREHLLGEFRKDMLSSNEVLCLTAYPNHKELFPEVELKGGVCYFVRGMKYDGACNYSTISNGVIETAEVNLSEMDVFVREPLKAKIVAKVLSKAKNEKQRFVNEILSADTPFGVPTNPTRNKKIVYEVQNSRNDEFSVELHYLINNKRHTGYIKRDSIKKNADDIDKIKVYVPAAGGSGNDKIVLGKPIVAIPPSVCSQTYLYTTFASLDEAGNFVSYLKTRFFRFLVSAIKITQHAQSSVYKFVPVQDFSEVWTDEKLFAKYGITEDEKEYIMAGINIME